MTAPPRLVLASASPARAGLLARAGLAFDVVVSGVDEEALAAGCTTADDVVAVLARAKAEAVAAGLDAVGGDVLVLGCDSVAEHDGGIHGKPGTAAAARARWERLRGSSLRLVTGHHLVRVGGGRVVASASAVVSTVVRFCGDLTDAELDAYVATGEPLQVAGAFTLDGRSSPFVEGVEGCPSNVIGLSLPALRRLLRELGA